VRKRQHCVTIPPKITPIRVRIAHAVLESGELTLSADEEMDIREVYKWLSLTKCIARHMLKSDFPNEFLPYITASGDVVDTSKL
jgi:hypothetical protein